MGMLQLHQANLPPSHFQQHQLQLLWQVHSGEVRPWPSLELDLRHPEYLTIKSMYVEYPVKLFLSLKLILQFRCPHLLLLKPIVIMHLQLLLKLLGNLSQIMQPLLQTLLIILHSLFISLPLQLVLLVSISDQHPRSCYLRLDSSPIANGLFRHQGNWKVLNLRVQTMEQHTHR